MKKEVFNIKDKMNDDDQLLLNVTSGTAQMESALIVINTLLDIDCKTIQVDSPKGKSNSDDEPKKLN